MDSSEFWMTNILFDTVFDSFSTIYIKVFRSVELLERIVESIEWPPILLSSYFFFIAIQKKKKGKRLNFIIIARCKCSVLWKGIRKWVLTAFRHAIGDSQKGSFSITVAFLLRLRKRNFGKTGKAREILLC